MTQHYINSAVKYGKESWLTAILLYVAEILENRKYLRGFAAKFENILGDQSGPQRKLFQEKKPKTKNLVILSL